jgi:cation diffusion facilitator CzcD-associated flavoprotein CzcO
VPAESELEVVIVGAGFGGIGAAIELRRHGFHRIKILDRAPELGGTWHHNTYPGAACDVPSHLYSFSFAQRRDWDRLCPLQSDILGYLRGVARDFGIAQLVTPGAEVTSCDWDEAMARWTISAADGREWGADALIIATGQLHRPATPRIPGIESFAGHSFHSAEWDHDYDLRGRRVAVVGTGASAVQFVPEIAERAEKLTVFQRTGNWFMPRRNRPYPAWWRAIIRWIPGVQALRRRFVFNYGESLTAMIRNPKTLGRVGRLRSSVFMRWQVRDPELRRKIWPDYTFGCKRVLFSSLFLPALTRENVELVDDPITAVTPKGVITAAGLEFEADCIIWGTGFRTNDFMFPMQVTGAGGRTLEQEWEGGAHAHLGISVPGFPSMFVMYGPNTNTSGGSIIFYLEAQAAYIRRALEQVRDRGAAAIAVRGDVERRSDGEVQERFAGTAWTQCDSWYRTDGGRIVANWPGYMREYAEATAELDPAEYEFTAAPSPIAGVKAG